MKMRTIEINNCNASDCEIKALFDFATPNGAVLFGEIILNK